MGSSGLWGDRLPVLRKALSVISVTAQEHLVFLRYGPRHDLREKARERVSDLLYVYGKMMEIYGRDKRRKNGLDFDDLMRGAVSLLLENKDGALDRLRRRYSHVLVDEFQDTDGLQWKLFSKPHPGPGGHDTQSIVFWDSNVRRYVLFTRYWAHRGE